MNKTEISKFLHGVIEPDGKWIEQPEICNEHDIHEYYDGWICVCGQTGIWADIDSDHHKPIKNPDYFTEKGFFVLWEWAIKQDWWIDFCFPIKENDGGVSRIINELSGMEYKLNKLNTNAPILLINYKKFPELLAGWLRNSNE